MLEEKDLQAIGALLDQKLKTTEERLTNQFDEKIGEVLVAVNETFSSLETRFDKLESKVDTLNDEIAKRPTEDRILSWADRRLTDLEIAKERHDFLHINELNNLPAPAEINRVLIERGFKQKLA